MDLDIFVLIFWPQFELKLPGNCVCRKFTEAGEVNAEGPWGAMFSPGSLLSPLLKISKDRKAPLHSDFMMILDGKAFASFRNKRTHRESGFYFGALTFCQVVPVMPRFTLAGSMMERKTSHPPLWNGFLTFFPADKGQFSSD